MKLSRCAFAGCRAIRLLVVIGALLGSAAMCRAMQRANPPGDPALQLPDESSAILIRERSTSGAEAWYEPASDGSGTYIYSKRLNEESGFQPWEISLFLFGLAGQAMFMGRFAWQWIVSERRRKSVIPVGFWYLSLLGATMLLTYFILRREPIGILGQGLGWIVYIRNLMLIHRDQRRTGQSHPTDPAEHTIADPNVEP